MVAGYYFTRRLEAWPISNQETKMMAEKLLMRSFSFLSTKSDVVRSKPVS